MTPGSSVPDLIRLQANQGTTSSSSGRHTLRCLQERKKENNFPRFRTMRSLIKKKMLPDLIN